MNWQYVIASLKQRQSLIEAGNTKRLDIESLIQCILSDQLHGNWGHARAFLEDPELEKRSANRVIDKIRELMPDFNFNESDQNKERE